MQMPWIRFIAVVILITLTSGCASPASDPNANQIVFIVAGVGGANGYDGLAKAIARPGRSVRVWQWGSPIFLLNFSSESIHNDAETKLAKELQAWRDAHPDGKIELIGHSAGCGVILGSLPRFSGRVESAILLAPSVSPSYDLKPALEKLDQPLQVFHSDRDTTFLSWRTSTFGTYDRIKTKAAGNMGFSGDFPADRVIQHPYDTHWSNLGNDGGHFGSLSGKFAEQILNPLIPAP